MTGYRWQITPEIRTLLDEINALKIVVTKYPPQPEILESVRRRNLLKSAVYSARVEDIPAQITDPQVHRKIEIQNLLSAYSYVLSPRAPKKFSESLISGMHRKIVKNISGSAGHYRSESWGIFNQAGIAVYLAPAHFHLPNLMPEYVRYTNQIQEPAPVIAAIAQFIFEKIHPFADGNGRVGRLISTYLLHRFGYGLKGLGIFEEYTDNNREEYYRVLEPNNDCTPFIEYFLRSLVKSTQDSLSQLTSATPFRPEDYLLPRRREILAIIRDHPGCSFDFLSRRFSAVKPSTLHYDLLQLLKANLITKHGITRAVVYSSASS